ncbi:hypothetical protein Aple_057640 [Acrocarpospora pleiomorpha]|uniref:Uncharacterized protein n=1 Tax=Acrocarpospora pleiomorpha TaxID=90975 RepID=A0A5M3XNG2_9ACTN|nr:hypothetical protein Aple_057640 [Acrocarpospora pleiomorpha]
MTCTLSVASPQDTFAIVVVTLLDVGAGGFDGGVVSVPARAGDARNATDRRTLRMGIRFMVLAPFTSTGQCPQ